MRIRTMFPVLALCASLPATGQETYQQPPPPIAQILDADQTPLVRLSPDRIWLLLLERPGLPPIAEVSTPELRLAKLRINPRTGGRSRETTLKRLVIRPIAGSTERRIETPPGARIGHVSISPNGRNVAFSVATDDGLALWSADVATGKTRKLTDARLNTAIGSGPKNRQGNGGGPYAWLNTDGLVCQLIPPNRGTTP